jgi:hypothetical protein
MTLRRSERLEGNEPLAKAIIKHVTQAGRSWVRQGIDLHPRMKSFKIN